MQSMEQRALAFLYQLEEQYFVNRDMDFVIGMLHPNITWVGIGEDEICKNYDDARRLLLAEQDGFYNNFILLNHWFQTIPLSESQCMVFGEVHVKENAPHAIVMDLHLRVSAVCVLLGEEVKLYHLHFSTPNAEQGPGEFFPKQLMKTNNKLLREMVDQQSRELRQRNRDLELLSANIPGGVRSCTCEEAFLIAHLSSGFLSMFGYTREEITQLFQDQALNMVCVEERARAEKSIRKQLLQYNTFEVEYPVLRKDGTSIWVLDKGQMVRSEDGEDYIYSVLVDITNTKRAQEELRLSLERYQIIMDQTNDIIFEWDIINDTLTASGNWVKTFGYLPHSKTTGELPITANVHAEDRPLFEQLKTEIKAGQPYSSTEVRMRKKDGSYLWCRVRASAQFDENGRSFKCVGVILDIDREKKQSERLMEKAERDALTGLYNKSTVQNHILSTLEQTDVSHKHALFIIDIDNFKLVNDTLGHLFGDAVLADVARNLQKSFRSTDLIGRIGGDEFMVFVRNVPDEFFVAQKAKTVIETFEHIFAGEKKDYQISCSIGIALYPESALTYQELYQRADQALYQAKKQGKNGYTFYDGALVHEQLALRIGEACTSVNEKIDSEDQSRVLNDKLVEYVFRMLYKSIDMETAVNLILEIVGRHFDVSRVYIFESTEDGVYCNNTFEWCNDGVAPEIETLQHLSYKDDLADYLTNFDNDDIFYCRDIMTLHQNLRDILSPQGVASLLQCAIKDGGEFKGYVGFDECRTNRLWTQDQVDALSFIAEILSTFLVKKRAQDRLAQTLALVKTVLDNQSARTYVVDQETYELLFINKKTLDIAPDTTLGAPCYQAFFGREKPCEICPIEELKKGYEITNMEVPNEMLHIWSSVEASTIHWAGDREAYLLCCSDITKYKLKELGKLP